MAGTEKVILTKKELVYGTDPVPTGALNAFLTRNFQSAPLEVDKLDRNLDVPTRGASPSAVTNRRSSFSYETELAGSGTAGIAPAWMELLEACGMAPPVLTATTDAKQRFLGAGLPLSSLSQYHWKSNQKRVATGVRGTFGLTFTAGAYPFLRFNGVGMVPASPIVELAPPVVDFDRWIDPVEVNLDNTVFTLGGYAPAMKELTIDAEATVAIRSLVGKRYVNKANHKLNFSMTIDAPDIGIKNYWTEVGKLIPMSLTHGTEAGNIIGLSTNNLQILDIKEGEEDDVLQLTITGQLGVVVGSDDLLITAK